MDNKRASIIQSVMKSWRAIRLPILVFFVAMIVGFVVLVIFELPSAFERRATKEETEETVAFIQAQKLTMADVTGENLPPVPDPALVDATVEGVDANNNLIRDDVELAIFELYPDDPVIRSAMLQYAMGLQLELTQVFNSETWVAAVQESSRGLICIVIGGPTVRNGFSVEEVEAASPVIDARIGEVESLIYNNDIRIQRKDEVVKFTDGHGESDKESDCDIDPTIFSTEAE